MISISAILARQDKSTQFKLTLTKHTTHTNVPYSRNLASNDSDHFKIKDSPYKVRIQCYKSLTTNQRILLRILSNYFERGYSCYVLGIKKLCTLKYRLVKCYAWNLLLEKKKKVWRSIHETWITMPKLDAGYTLCSSLHYWLHFCIDLNFFIINLKR